MTPACSGVLAAAAGADAAGLGPGGLWLDDKGLMVYEASPAKVCAHVVQLTGSLTPGPGLKRLAALTGACQLGHVNA